MNVGLFRFAFAVPASALLLSLLLLLPYRHSLTAQVKVAIAPLTAAPASAPGGAEERRYAQVAALNLPALLAELPTAMLSDDHSSWSPSGMDFRVWRALSYPFVGVFFWWLIGRGADVLRSTTQLKWFETAFAALLSVTGILFCIGWFTGTTAEDRADANLHWIGLGVMLWLLLEAIPVTAGTLKLRQRRRTSDGPGRHRRRR